MKTALELARVVAEICGPHSGAARAVALYERLTADGKEPLIVQERGRWIVIHDPMPSSSAEAARAPSPAGAGGHPQETKED